MLKKKGFIMILVVGLLIFATNVFALVPLQTFDSYKDDISSGSSSWDQTLLNDDFQPQLIGGEPLIINSANLSLRLTFTPDSALSIYLYSVNAYLESYHLGTYFYLSQTPGTFTRNWFVPITNQLALNEIADKNVHIDLISTSYGTLNSVEVSNLTGTYSVAPEPVSMLLVGVGIAGLPVAGRFRRFIKKG